MAAQTGRPVQNQRGGESCPALPEGTRQEPGSSSIALIKLKLMRLKDRLSETRGSPYSLHEETEASGFSALFLTSGTTFAVALSSHPSSFDGSHVIDTLKATARLLDSVRGYRLQPEQS